MSEKLVIDKSTLVGIADAIRTKDGSSAVIPVPNLRQKILDIPSGSASHLVRKDVIRLESNLTYANYGYSTTCGCGRLQDHPQLANIKCPDGAHYCRVYVSNFNSATPLTRTMISASFVDEVIWNNIKNLVPPNPTMMDTNKALQGCGILTSGYACNANWATTGTAVRNFYTNIITIYTSIVGTDLESALFDEYDSSVLLASELQVNLGSIDKNGDLIGFIARNQTGEFIFKSDSEITIEWYDFENPPICGQFVD